MTRVTLPFDENEGIDSLEDQINDTPVAGVTVTRKGSAGHATGARVEFGTAEPTADLRTLKPFTTVTEMTEATEARLRDGSTRMHVDAEYRAEVLARIALSYGTERVGLNQTPVFVGAEGSEERRKSMLDSLTIETPEIQDVFSSMDEVVVAMNDPRYSNDPSYRAQIDAKVGRSPF